MTVSGSLGFSTAFFALIASCGGAAAQGLATTAAQSPAPAARAVEPDAAAALKRMGAYLRSLDSFEVTAETTIDEVTDEGEKLQFGGSVSLQARRPDRLRAEVDNDRRQRQLIYDGETLTVYGPRAGYYATVPAPKTIRELLDLAERRYGIDVPLADLFRWGEADASTSAISEAAIVGPARIGNVACDHVAVRQAGIDWQVWVEQGKTPLPRKLVVTTRSEPEQPQYAAVLHWQLDPKFDAATFSFVPPKGTRRILLRGDAAANAK